MFAYLLGARASLFKRFRRPSVKESKKPAALTVKLPPTVTSCSSPLSAESLIQSQFSISSWPIPNLSSSSDSPVGLAIIAKLASPTNSRSPRITSRISSPLGQADALIIKSINFDDNNEDDAVSIDAASSPASSTISSIFIDAMHFDDDDDEDIADISSPVTLSPLFLSTFLDGMDVDDNILGECLMATPLSGEKDAVLDDDAYDVLFARLFEDVYDNSPTTSSPSSPSPSPIANWHCNANDNNNNDEEIADDDLSNTSSPASSLSPNNEKHSSDNRNDDDNVVYTFAHRFVIDDDEEEEFNKALSAKKNNNLSSKPKKTVSFAHELCHTSEGHQVHEFDTLRWYINQAYGWLDWGIKVDQNMRDCHRINYGKMSEDSVINCLAAIMNAWDEAACVVRETGLGLQQGLFEDLCWLAEVALIAKMEKEGCTWLSVKEVETLLDALQVILEEGNYERKPLNMEVFRPVSLMCRQIALAAL